MGANRPAHRETFDGADRTASHDDGPHNDDPDHTAPHPGSAGRIALHRIAAVEHDAAEVGRSNDDPRCASAEALKEVATSSFEFAASGSLALLAAAGCTSITPQSPGPGIGSIEANGVRRETPEFCRRYADQTFTNTFQSNTDTSSSDGVDQQARITGGVAYRRCLAGRTN